eukprot:TRINITY_DN40743_c0_g1_i1.p1 TRINITY_DN40743_c0_g1~~TRINITY_DN40743_c0_g1_i1.p1  ORF type:complete len:144 (+),score=20.81 TRINITY_DN40743_c0_g1_i1:60-491(+)
MALGFRRRAEGLVLIFAAAALVACPALQCWGCKHCFSVPSEKRRQRSGSWTRSDWEDSHSRNSKLLAAGILSSSRAPEASVADLVISNLVDFVRGIGVLLMIGSVAAFSQPFSDSDKVKARRFHQQQREIVERPLESLHGRSE